MSTIDRLNAALTGRYVVESELGEGGAATVYLAEDVRHRRKVALKLLKPELAAIVGAERFLSEIETTARLQHPNILPLFDSGEADGFLFYVMPYVEGESLRARLDRERQLPVDEAVRIGTDVAEALQAAHEHGVVHRDVKPANILLSRGRPLVADFGIALALSAAGGHRLTETGLSVGTPHYMSPEQATGDQAVGPASDIYSLGCVLYEMLLGEPPYTGSTAQAILGRIITSEPDSVTTQRRAVPPHVDAVVAKALEKVPADRFRSAAELAGALGDESFRHRAAASGMSARRAGVLTAAGWGLAAVLGGLWLTSAFTPDAPRPVRSFSLALTADETPSEWLALAPDGSAVVLNDGPPGAAGSHMLVVKRLDDLVHVPVQGSEEAWDPVVSPDGQAIAFASPSGLLSAPLSGGTARTLVDGTTPCCLRWASDGFVYYADFASGSMYRVRATGGEPELVIEAGTGERFTYYQPLPHADRAVVGVASDRHQIEIMDVREGRREVLTDGVRPFVTDEGYLVFVREGGGLFAAAIDAESMSLAASPVLMVDGIGYQDVGDAMFSLSVSGDLVYWVLHGESIPLREVVWVDRQGRATSVDTTWLDEFESVQISPSGTRVAVGAGPSEQSEIWLRDLDGGLSRRLTGYSGLNRRPVWSPDGTSLAFITDRGGSREAYELRVDGIASPRPLLQVEGQDVDEASWSPDGSWLIYRTGTQNGTRDIFAKRLAPDTTTLVVSALPGVDEGAAALSPDGRWLAHASNETGQNEIWVRPFPDVGRGSRQISFDGGTEPVWSDRGDELFYRSGDGIVSVAIDGAGDFSTGRVQRLFSAEDYLPFGVYRAFDFDSDRDRFLMIREVRQELVQPELILVQNFMEEVRARLGG